MNTKHASQFFILSALAFSSASTSSVVGDDRVQWPAASGGNGHSYQAILAPNGITWQAAWEAATAMGGYLATPTSAAENDFVFGLVSTNDSYWFLNSGGSGVGPWLGGFQVDGATEPAGGWSWVTGELFGYASWGVGQPDNSEVNQNRIHFFGRATLKGKTWNDYPGSPAANFPSPRGFIVEWTPASPPANPMQWTLASGGNGHFYQAFLVATGITWQAASDVATSVGGYLATASSAAENEFIYGLVSGEDSFWFLNTGGNGVGPWLGGLQSEGALEPGGGWHWITGEPFTYTAWGTSQPDNWQTNQNRLHFYGGGTLKDRAWNDYAGVPIASQPSTRGFVVEWSFAPPPTLSAYAAVELCFPTMPNTQYQVQWAASLPGTNWTDLGAPVLGDGATKCIFDSTRGNAKRFYQVLVLP
jgi:hypothetical protein